MMSQIGDVRELIANHFYGHKFMGKKNKSEKRFENTLMSQHLRGRLRMHHHHLSMACVAIGWHSENVAILHQLLRVLLCEDSIHFHRCWSM